MHRSVTILAAIPKLASQLLVLSALKESAAQVHVNSRSMGQRVGDLADSVTLGNTAAGNLQSALLMCIVKMEHRVTVTRPIASLENARPTMTSASTTSEPVSNFNIDNLLRKQKPTRAIKMTSTCVYFDTL